MVIVDDTAIGANRNIHASFTIVFITGLANFNQGRRLTTTDTFRFAGNADGAAADTDFDEISTAIGKEIKAFPIDDVTSTYFYSIAIGLTNPCQSPFLPFRKTF